MEGPVTAVLEDIAVDVAAAGAEKVMHNVKEHVFGIASQLTQTLLHKLNPGSFADIHNTCLSTFPSPFIGLKVSILNNFCDHSRSFTCFNTDPWNQALEGRSSLKFDYRWYGSSLHQHLDSNPLFYEIPGLEKLQNCSHGTLLRSLSKIRGRITGDALKYLPSALAMNFDTISAEYVGTFSTTSLTFNDILIGDKEQIESTIPGSMSRTNLVEGKLQSLFKVSPHVDVGFQIRKVLDTRANLDGQLWSLGLGARLDLPGLLISGTLSSGDFEVFSKLTLSNDFSIGIGYLHSALEKLACRGLVAWKFSDSESGLVVKLAADTKGRIVTSIAKNLANSYFQMPITVVVTAEVDAKATPSNSKVDFGVGFELA